MLFYDYMKYCFLIGLEWVCLCTRTHLINMYFYNKCLLKYLFTCMSGNLGFAKPSVYHLYPSPNGSGNK